MNSNSKNSTSKRERPLFHSSYRDGVFTEEDAKQSQLNIYSIQLTKSDPAELKITKENINVTRIEVLAKTLIFPR